jgi:hypothetical protein
MKAKFKTLEDLLRYLKETEGYKDNEIITTGTLYCTPLLIPFKDNCPAALTYREDSKGILWVTEWFVYGEEIKCSEFALNTSQLPRFRKVEFKTISEVLGIEFDDPVSRHDQKVTELLSDGWEVVGTGLTTQNVWTKLKRGP